MIVDVYADVVCPWCYIGARRLEQALAQRPELQVERRWRPFQLQPQMPAAGLPWREFAREKFGGEARMAAMFQHTAQVGAADGLTFAFDRVVSAPNTVDAHRLILFAAQHGKQWETANALFRAYFAEGRDLNNIKHLAAAAEQAGLPPEQVRTYLGGRDGIAEVAESQTTAYQYGINSVPYYILNGRYAVAGAQPSEVWLRVLDHLRDAAAAVETRHDIHLSV